MRKLIGGAAYKDLTVRNLKHDPQAARTLGRVTAPAAL
jgi:hypothetical protein